MLQIICYLVVLFACSIGTVCGMGGGIIIKPVLDAIGVMSVATINFLSGCTVIAMTCWNLGKTMMKKESVIELRSTTFLAIGAAIGGITGKQLFNLVAACFTDPNMAGGIQACLLFAATFATFIYTINKDKIRSRHLTQPVIIVILGFLLGVLGAFLGIGGGPFNVAVLYYFFSMPTKKATQNSLYVILFSQVASTAKTIVSGNIPSFDFLILGGMMVFAIFGSELGRRLNKKLDEKQATLLLEAAIVLIMCINIYNIYKYLG